VHLLKKKSLGLDIHGSIELHEPRKALVVDWVSVDERKEKKTYISKPNESWS
jgi:hypothetical protein